MTFVIFKHVVSDNGNLSVVGDCIDDFVSVREISNSIKSDKAFTVIEIKPSSSMNAILLSSIISLTPFI